MINYPLTGREKLLIKTENNGFKNQEQRFFERKPILKELRKVEKLLKKITPPEFEYEFTDVDGSVYKIIWNRDDYLELWLYITASGICLGGCSRSEWTCAKRWRTVLKNYSNSQLRLMNSNIDEFLKALNSRMDMEGKK